MASSRAIGKKAVHLQWAAFFIAREKTHSEARCVWAMIGLRSTMSSRLQRFMLRSINWWPPFLAAGIHVRWGGDHRSADVTMRLHFWNRNYVGTHYGGSLYSMTDPFYMLMLMENLGRDYIVWDKAASIRFRKPGKGTVRAEFRLTEQQLDDIRNRLVSQDKYEPVFLVEVRDEAGNSIAEVEKVVHIRRKASVDSKQT
jgi:hypothetical protein